MVVHKYFTTGLYLEYFFKYPPLNHKEMKLAAFRLSCCHPKQVGANMFRIVLKSILLTPSPPNCPSASFLKAPLKYLFLEKFFAPSKHIRCCSEPSGPGRRRPREPCREAFSGASGFVAPALVALPALWSNLVI